MSSTGGRDSALSLRSPSSSLASYSIHSYPSTSTALYPRAPETSVDGHGEGEGEGGGRV